jgi:RHS repeat-associated protein
MKRNVMCLGWRGRRSVWARATALMALGSVFGGQLRVAYASRPSAVPVTASGANEPRSNGTVPPPAPRVSDGGRAIAARVRPARLIPLEGADARALGRLFDDRAATTLESGGHPVRFRVELDEPAYLESVGSYGPVAGALHIDAETGAGRVVPLAARAGRASERWNRTQLVDAPPSKAFVISWSPSGRDAALRELELWARPASGAAPAPALLPDSLYAGVPAGAAVAAAPEGEQIISPASVGAPGKSGTFNVRLDADPRVFGRAFLVYELRGLPHFTAAVRAINGHAAAGGFGASPGAAGGLQVEEIAPAWLSRGANAIQFFPFDPSNPASYRVSDLRVVGIPARGSELDDAGARAFSALRDGREETGWSDHARRASDARAWTFGNLVQPRTLELRLPKRGAGSLTIVGTATGTRQRITVNLGELSAGWHEIPIDALPVSDRLMLSLTGDEERGAALSELAITASPLPADEAPRVSVAYPLSGECVNHRVHLRGFVEPAEGATLFINGTRRDAALSADGAFAVDLGEAELGPADAAEGRAARIAVSYASGARVSRLVPVGACVDRPPAVVTDDGRRRQPKDDLGAPYGVTVRAGKAATLSFAGAKLEIPAGAVERDVRITVRPLGTRDVAAMDPGMTNVTPAGQAFRFGPLGMRFKKPVKMTLPFDRALLAAGDTGADVRTFYYDEALQRWEQVGLVGQSETAMQAVSDHFTDFINATIAMPEHPGPQSLNPTSLKEMKVADPAASIPRIEPPSPSSSGSADLHFPIEVPPGRRGVQPNLSINYGNESGNGWVGVGWDLRISSIDVDTRFGVPRYAGDEVYSLDGDLLTPIKDNAGNPTGLYRRRVEGRFDRIERLGTSPDTYSWKVTDKNGTVSVFGGSAATRLSDPVAARGSHIFRWQLDSMTDTYGNQMKYRYQADNASVQAETGNSEPFAQLYPQGIDYTSNAGTGLAAAYHVNFVLDDISAGGRRADAFSNARSGFQVLTRHLLKAIEVRVDLPGGATNQLVRKYVLGYVDGAFSKKLLSNVSMLGQDGATSLYTYNFTYAPAPAPTATFAPVTPWGQMKKIDGAVCDARSGEGLTSSDGDMSGLGASFGFGIGPLHITAGGGVMGGSDTTRMREVDLNGDGLPDYLDEAQGANVAAALPPASPPPDHFQCSASVPLGLGTGFLGHTSRSGWNFDGSLGVAGIVGAGAGYSQTTAEDDHLLADIDGDGFADEVFVDNGQVSVRRNDGTGNFGPTTSWGEVALDDRSLDVAKWNGASRTGDYPVQTLTRWRAPFPGHVTLSGSITKVRPGGDGIKASIYFNAETTPRWQGSIDGATLTACTPSTTSGCTGTTPLQFTVAGGDRLYFLVDPIANINADDIQWDPTFTYDQFAANPTSREPYGAPTYQFSEKSDMRLYGLPDITWVANANGTVQLTGVLQKQSISDDVVVQLQKSPHATTPPAPTTLLTLPAASTGAFDLGAMNLTFTVTKGDQYRLQVVADTMVDPQRAILENARLTYIGTFCRDTGKNKPQVCGPLQYQTQTGATVTKLGVGDRPVSARIQGDTVTMDGAAVSRQMEPYFPRKELIPFAANASVAVSGTQHVAGTATVPVSLHTSVTVLVQGVNRLYAKGTLSAGQSLPVSVDVTNDQVFFTVLGTTSSQPISWAPTVNGQAAAVNYRTEDTDFYRYDPLANPVKLPNDSMSGGFHSWFFGDWDGTVAFSEGNFHFPDVTKQRNNFMFCGPLTSEVDDPTLPPPPLPPQRWACRGLDAYIGAGVQKPSKQATGAGDVGKLQSLRLAETSNLNLNANVAVLEGGVSWGSTVSTLDFMDMNGDRFPDSITAGGIRYSNGVTYGAGGVTGPAVPAFGDTVPVNLGNVRDVEHRNVRGGFQVSISDDDGQLLNITDSAGNSEGVVSTNLGVGAGVDWGLSSSNEDLIDMNGDGLPDKVSQAADTGRLFVRLNLGYGFGNTVEWPNAPSGFGSPDFGVPSELGAIPAFGDVGPNAVTLQDSLANSITAGAGIGFAGVSAGDVVTTSRTLVQYVDVNGDGLPDKVMKRIGASDTDQIRVMLNQGTSFLPPLAWTLPDDWGVGDLNPQGAFDPPQGLIFAQDPHTLSFHRQEGWQASLSVEICFILCVGVSGFTSGSSGWSQMDFADINGDGKLDHVLKKNGDANVYAKVNLIKNANMLTDVSGPLGDTLHMDYDEVGHFVGPSPVSGEPKIDMPEHRWVLSKVRIGDGRGNFYTDQINYRSFSSSSADTQAASAAATGPATGFHDRIEREDYGFAHLEVTHGVKVSGAWTEGDGSQVEQFFYNQDFYLKRRLKAEFELDSAGKVFRGTFAGPQALVGVPGVRTGWQFPSKEDQLNAFYEQTLTKGSIPSAVASATLLAGKLHKEHREFDGSGNLTLYIDGGDESTTADDVAYKIAYDSVDPINNVTRANDVKAFQTSVTGALLRERTATFDAGKGTVHSLTNLVTGGKVPGSGTPGTLYNNQSSTSSFTYDGNGNLKTETDPAGFVLTYAYDAGMQIHRSSITDSFGYVSTSAPNYRYGVDDSRSDLNGQPETFVYDNFGRLSKVFGPDDQGAAEATIALAYNAAASPPVAVTKHKDVQHANDPVETVTFIDGLRRVIETKKDLDQDAAGNGTVATGMSVTGLVGFDGRGRIKSQGQPQFVKGGLDTDFVVTMPVNPTLYSYDILGRRTALTQPDGTTTRTDYLVTPTSAGSDPITLASGSTWLETRMTDASSNRRLSFSDARSNRLAVQEFNTIGTATTLTTLTTKYAYDPLDQLLSVTDAKGNVTSAAYDSLGRMVTVTSPDAGQTEMRYDLAGNLGEKQTPTLRAQSKVIKYGYDFDRLKSITYPSLPTVTYTYGASTEKGDANGNRAGRIKTLTMEAGSEQRFYDRMGNVNKTLTTLNNMSQSNPPTVTWTMKFTTDWMGRMLNMTFPNWMDNTYQFISGEGELVSYAYDHGGNIDRITGHHQTPNPQQTSHPIDFVYLNHMGYDAFEQRTVLTSGNGIANKYTYDALTRRLTDVSADALGSQEKQAGKPATPFHRIHYTYDAVGNIIHLTNNVSVQPWRNAAVFVGPLDVTYTYDKLYQLRSLNGKYRPAPAYGYQYSSAYTYDEVGNIKTKANSQDRLVWDNQTVNTGDSNPVATQLAGSRFDHNVGPLTYTLAYQYGGTRPHATNTITETDANTSPAARNYTYDANGNNTGNSFQGTTRAQIWDEENRLKEVDRSGGMLAKFRYNPSGERIKKQTAAGDAWYVNQFFVLLPNNLPTKHIYAGQTRIASKTDAIYMQTPVLNYFHTDNLGSTSYTSVPNQDLTQHERYFAFGELWRPGAEQEECDLGRPDNLRREWTFTGKEWDVDTSLYNFGARYFDPHADVWQSPDPVLPRYLGGEPNGGVGFPRNLGLYTYSWNNPVTMLDPDGFAPGDPWYKRVGLTVVGIGYGTLQAVAPGGAFIDAFKVPSDDQDFLVGKASANLATGVVQVVGGSIIAGGGAAVSIGSGGTLAIAGAPVAVAGVAEAAQGATNIAAAIGTFQMASRGGGGRAPEAKKEYPRDYSTKNTINRSAQYGSEGEARALARQKVGSNPVEVEPGKLRSQDGVWQYRAKAQDLSGHGPGDTPHIHLERLDPQTGEVLENWHLRW